MHSKFNSCYQNVLRRNPSNLYSPASGLRGPASLSLHPASASSTFPVSQSWESVWMVFLMAKEPKWLNWKLFSKEGWSDELQSCPAPGVQNSWECWPHGISPTIRENDSPGGHVYPAWMEEGPCPCLEVWPSLWLGYPASPVTSGKPSIRNAPRLCWEVKPRTGPRYQAWYTCLGRFHHGRGLDFQIITQPESSSKPPGNPHPRPTSTLPNGMDCIGNGQNCIFLLNKQRGLGKTLARDMTLPQYLVFAQRLVKPTVKIWSKIFSFSCDFGYDWGMLGISAL